MVRAHALARVVPMLLWLVASAVVWALPAAAEEAAAASSAPPAVLLLGPLPSPPAAAAEGPLAPGSELVPELDPLAADPWQSGIVATVGQRSLAWRRARTGDDGRVQLAEPGVYWLATRLELARWTELSLELDRLDLADGSGRGRGRGGLHRPPAQSRGPLLALPPHLPARSQGR